MSVGKKSVLFLGLLSAVLAAKPLKSWKLCSRSDPHINECLKAAIEQAIKGLKDGNSKLGILPLDPLHISKLQIHQDSGPVAVKLDFQEVDIHGIAHTVVDRVKMEWDKTHLEIDAHVEGANLVVVGNYEIAGKVLTLPIKGSGPFNLTFNEYSSKIVLDGKDLEKDGVLYKTWNDASVHIDASRVHMLFENLFNGDKALGEQMNVFLNENWQEILNELRPTIAKALRTVASQIANLVFHKVPFNDIAPA